MYSDMAMCCVVATKDTGTKVDEGLYCGSKKEVSGQNGISRYGDMAIYHNREDIPPITCTQATS